MRPSLHTISGTSINDYKKIDIDTVIFGLARNYRYSSQTDITVAEHTVLCVNLCEVFGRIDLIRAALWHDSTEALFGDIADPLKKLISIEGIPFKDWENKILMEIAEHRNIQGMDDPFLHKIDKEYAIIAEVNSVKRLRKNPDFNHIPVTEEYNKFLTIWQNKDYAEDELRKTFNKYER